MTIDGPSMPIGKSCDAIDGVQIELKCKLNFKAHQENEKVTPVKWSHRKKVEASVKETF